MKKFGEWPVAFMLQHERVVREARKDSSVCVHESENIIL